MVRKPTLLRSAHVLLSRWLPAPEPGKVVVVIGLEPAPAAIATLLVSLTEVEWPTTETERLRFFTQFALQDLGAFRTDEQQSETESRQFRAELSSNISGSSTMFRGEFLSLTMFCYDEQFENGSQARAGYEALHEQFSRRLGQPDDEFGSQSEPGSSWRAGPLTLDMYCFQRLRSNIMISLAHAARSGANDAAFDERADRSTGSETGP